MKHRTVKVVTLICVLVTALAGCGKKAAKSQVKPAPTRFAALANQNQRHIWYETTGKNVSKDSKITYLLVTQNGKVTVYTVNSSLGGYNRFTDNHAIAEAKRADKQYFQSKQQDAYTNSKAKQVELTQKLNRGQVKSAKKRQKLQLAIKQLKNRRWKIETTRYEAPKPQSYSVKLVKKNDRIKGEKIIYRSHDYEGYLNQFADADSWLKNNQLGPRAKKIKPVSAFFKKTDGAKTVYKHRFHKPQKTIIDKYIGYLEVKQQKGDKLKKMKKNNSLKEGNSLLYRANSSRDSTAFDKASTKHVTLK
ncbi:hypothetical protein [Secundilactobacillus folii]|uniref:Lipoprotein n=1 Tax=Secundilactobacillus folii TaxID=2678357 RepID=A0A7X2XWV5_9LACO|nr:hypothetical protein [Secundilactobacillus folii]MTV83137.1 hypothetical protein [Secundilactobacillus folii]